MAQHKININESILVQVTEFGYQKWKAHQDSYLPKEFQHPLSYYKDRANDEGFVSIQIWEFMQIFGSFMRMGIEPPMITDNCIIVNIKD